MPKVTHVKKARKDNPAVKAGEQYWWWKTRLTIGKRYISQKHYSATRPKLSQLISSPFFSSLQAAKEIVEDSDPQSLEDLQDIRDEYVGELENARDEAQESLDQLPEQFQETHMLNERVEEMEAFISEIESIDIPDSDPDEDILHNLKEDIFDAQYQGE